MGNFTFSLLILTKVIPTGISTKRPQKTAMKYKTHCDNPKGFLLLKPLRKSCQLDSLEPANATLSSMLIAYLYTCAVDLLYLWQAGDFHTMQCNNAPPGGHCLASMSNGCTSAADMNIQSYPI